MRVDTHGMPSEETKLNKIEHMDRLKAEAVLLKDEVCDPFTRLVWGEGSLDSALAIVGEGPAADEDRDGRPFVGRVGRFLDHELAIAGIDRSQVYITNALKCWSLKMKGARRVNRQPSDREIKVWSDVLLRELEIVNPLVIMCLGNTAAGVLIHKPFVMSDDRGVWFDGPLGSRVMATFHPAYVARFGGIDDGIVIKQFRRDLVETAAVAKLKQ